MSGKHDMNMGGKHDPNMGGKHDPNMGGKIRAAIDTPGGLYPGH